MNNVIELKGKRFVQSPKKAYGGGVAMNGKVIVESVAIDKLVDSLNNILSFWNQEDRPFSGVLISVYYNKIVAKSNRISGLLKGDKTNEAVVGAKFNSDKDKHIIIYYVDVRDVEKSIELLMKTKSILVEYFNGSIGNKAFETPQVLDGVDYKAYSISKSKFKKVISDVSYIDNFSVETAKPEYERSIVSIFDTGEDAVKLMEKLDIDITGSRVLDNLTLCLDSKQLEQLINKAPYLIAMSTSDISELSPEDFFEYDENGIITIPKPTHEPIIGVIDTPLSTDVYFKEWVDYRHEVDANIPITSGDYSHGTAVASLIVDGPRLNPWLDDGCGRFRVRHFGVAVGNKFSSFSIVKKIKEIIVNNQDIHVWNLSLGSNEEINDNFISAEGYVLDQLQYEYDIIFVIAGTNKPSYDISKIGAPADSINSMVVNSVSKSKLATNYSRKGLALSFFSKPDVSYYGGSEEEYIRVCEPLGEGLVAGTSFAAPWIARKMSYLIDVIGLSREVAKAMIIDAARGWNGETSPENIALYGHGVAPIRIEDIIQTKDDEIRFLVSDVSEKWNTYNYSFPIPMADEKYPFIARATMCYFPICTRSQGVDYTNTELNLHFGRIMDNGKLNEINHDKQNGEDDSSSEKHYIFEGEARKNFRKWDNVKYICESSSKRHTPVKSYSHKNWGMEIKTNNRLDPKDGQGIRFGVVVTLKELNGKNRIDDFIRNCTLNGWLVNQIDVQNRIDIFEKVNEDIELF